MATPKGANRDHEYQQWIQRYLHLTQSEQEHKKKIKAIQDELAEVSEQLQTALTQDDIDELEIPQHGMLRRVVTERTCPLTLQQRDERIHAFFQDTPLGPVGATRLIDVLQQNKQKSISEKIVWTPLKK